MRLKNQKELWSLVSVPGRAIKKKTFEDKQTTMVEHAKKKAYSPSDKPWVHPDALEAS